MSLLPPLDRLTLSAGARTGVTLNPDGTVTLSKEESEEYLKSARKRAVYNATLAIAIDHFIVLLNDTWAENMGDLSGYGPEVESWSGTRERREFHQRFPVVKQLLKWRKRALMERVSILTQTQCDPIDEAFLRRVSATMQKYWASEILNWTDEDEKKVYAKLKAQATKMAAHDPHDKTG